MSQPDQLPRVFLSYRQRDDVSDIKAALVAASIAWEDAFIVAGPTTPHEAIAERIKACDAVIGVLDQDSASVLFDLGIAVGSGVPAIVIARRRSDIPSDLTGIAVVDRSAGLDTVGSVVRRAAAPEVRTRERKVTSRRVLSAEEAHELRERASGVTGSELSDLVAQVFRRAGAEVIVDYEQGASIERPDLVLWSEDLLAGFSVPLPIEVLIRPISVEALVPRLRRTLQASGSRALLAVHVNARPEEPDPQVWEADDGRFILVLSFGVLLNALSQNPLAKALGTARQLAVPRRLS